MYKYDIKNLKQSSKDQCKPLVNHILTSCEVQDTVLGTDVVKMGMS